jgi:hypothetical protein
MLHGIGHNWIGLSGVLDDRLGKNAQVARGGYKPAASISKPVKVSVNRNGWFALRDVQSL